MEMRAGWQSGPASGEVVARGRGGCFAWEGAAEDCFAAGNGISAAADPPARLQGHGLVMALASWKWRKMPGPFVGVPVLGPPGHMRYLNMAVWGQGKVSCSPLAHAGDGAAGGCGSHPSWVLGSL